MATTTSTKDTEGAQYLKRPAFNKTFTLPATADHGALEVGYSDIGRQPAPADSSGEATPVILFMPGMFASRFIGVLMDAVAEKMGVRVLTVDRPGMGQSTDVKLTQRVNIWVELVPKLLAHLGIRHVSLVSHSAGTIYLLNTLYSCRDVLSPTRPYAALLAPWVDAKHSGAKLLQAAQLIPNVAFGSWNTIVKSIGTNIAPVISSSAGFVGKWLPGSKPASDAESETSSNRLRWQTKYGLSVEFLDTIMDAVFAAMCAENTVGANSEARQCLKKEGDGTWGVCEDYDVFVHKLVEQERGCARDAKLRVKIFFAEDDVMIGKGGPRYMEACWGREEEFADVLEFTSTTVDGADHDSVLTLAAVLEEIIGDVAGVNQTHDRETS